MKKITSKAKWLAVSGLFLPMVTLAATGQYFGGQETEVSGAGGDLTEIVGNIINGALGIVGLIAVVMAVVGGIILATSGGDEEKVKSGKNYITYGVVGLVIALLAYAIVSWVISIL